MPKAKTNITKLVKKKSNNRNLPKRLQKELNYKKAYKNEKDNDFDSLRDLEVVIDNIRDTQIKVECQNKNLSTMKIKNNKKQKQKQLIEHIAHMKAIKNYISENKLSPINVLITHLEALESMNQKFSSN